MPRGALYFLPKMNSSTQKTPNLPYWASKSAKKRLKKNCWTKPGNLYQCALDPKKLQFAILSIKIGKKCSKDLLVKKLKSEPVCIALCAI